MRTLTVILLFVAAAAHAQPDSDPAQGLTPDFQTWLRANGYATANFERADLPGGSYGGRTSPKQRVVREPVIFIHGNSDRAIGSAAPFTGWRASIDFFKSKGYTSAELYATTWGPSDMSLAIQQYHSKAYLTQVRSFIEAVKKYTGAKKVDVIAHSMGVTLARKAIQGGSAFDDAAGGTYSLGPSIASGIDTFVGIAGANRGLAACFAPTVPTCSDRNGFYPGHMIDGKGPIGVSEILADVNATAHDEGRYVYTIWSKADTLIGAGALVFGMPTCQIPGQDGEVVFDAAPHGHVGSKDLTAETQWRMVTKHEK